MLEIRNLNAYYGKSHVLHGVDLDVADGEVVALLGRNGAGRSTLMKAVTGEVLPVGSVKLGGEQIAGWPTHRIMRHGVGYVPESRDVFAPLTVRENLLLGQRERASANDRWSVEGFTRRFPNLGERMDAHAGVLSGGEQQMLSMARALLGQPRLMLIDEPTEGLAPLIVQEIARMLLEMKSQGLAILLIEQKLDIALDVADRLYVMGHGEIVFCGTPAQFEMAHDVKKTWLEV